MNTNGGVITATGQTPSLTLGRRALHRLRGFIRRRFDRSPFGAITDAEAELLKLANIRIATGLLCIARLVPPWLASRYYFDDSGFPATTVDGSTVLVLIGLVTTGFLTPITLPLLMFSLARYEAELATESLSSNILALLFFVLLLTSAGARRSADAILLRRDGWVGAPARALYRVVGVPSVTGMRLCLGIAFIALSLINLGGAANHWLDEWWHGGYAMGMILSNSYMSRVWHSWRALEIGYPVAAGWTSWTLTMTQLVVQTMALAFVWWRPTAWLTIAWGTVFFLSSIVVLQLHYLGAFEMLIWLAVFYRPRTTVAESRYSAPFARAQWVERAIAVAATVFFCVFVAHEAWAFARDGEYPFPRLRSYIATIGVHSPNVFNENDLRLGDAWSVVYRGEREELLPYEGPQGERLLWPEWNDLVLYRTSIRWRNEFHPAAVLNPNGDGVARLRQLVTFDHRRRGAQQSRYVVDYYSSYASRVTIPAATRFDRTYIGTTRFYCVSADGRSTCEVQPDAK